MGAELLPYLENEGQPSLSYDVQFELLGSGTGELVGLEVTAQRQYGRDFQAYLSEHATEGQRVGFTLLDHRHENDRVVTIMSWGVETLDSNFSAESMLGQSTVLLADWLRQYGVIKPEILYTALTKIEGKTSQPKQDYTVEAQVMIEQLVALADTDFNGLL
jgi:hypothetical protein